MSTQRDRNSPYLAVLIQTGPSGHQHVHAGLARWGTGKTFCNELQLPEFWLPARDPNFALFRTPGWRHRYAEAFLERNTGCINCLNVLYRIGAESGYRKARSLAV